MSPTSHTAPSADAGLQDFERHRPRLFGLAYRMLGQRAEAEDLVQDVWLRWQDSERAAIAQPEAWLVTTATRLAIDRLRRLRVEREHYAGFWLPEPLVQPWTEAAPSAEELLEQAHDVSTALLFVLEQLTPEERAAFLLREVFDADYAEVAQALGRSEAACRQLVHRARAHVKAGRPRFEAPAQAHAELLRRFAQAARGGDLAQIQALFAPDAALISDGGGKVASFGRVLETGRRLALLYFATARRLRRDGQEQTLHLARVNGLPGLVRCVDGQVESVQTLLVEDGLIRRIYTLRNPDKLTRVLVPAA
ncbi:MULTISPECIES: RNA polymerase sigma-70 factor [Comamonas]|uniref:RNA polymerase sigma-70 factor n=1 Tax=Comamonas TaxID=283 RepID=UPI00050DDDBE|nr:MULTISPECIES: RNA polymerase sigma-70 factor [Comamonas]KGG86951.1 RNA polymerase subunit sigma-24 [Comamonas thiooxydans]BDB72495.1 sigma factor [Comamonas thiooxydans]GAO69563.1 RNA polymerase subunit sigma-24 [Comamonas sp. E6]